MNTTKTKREKRGLAAGKQMKTKFPDGKETYKLWARGELSETADQRFAVANAGQNRDDVQFSLEDWRKLARRRFHKMEEYHTQAEKLAEALRGMMNAFAYNAEQTVISEGETALQSDVKRARQTLTEWKASKQ